MQRLLPSGPGGNSWRPQQQGGWRGSPEGNKLLPAVSRLQSQTDGTTREVHREPPWSPRSPGP